MPQFFFNRGSMAPFCNPSSSPTSSKAPSKSRTSPTVPYTSHHLAHLRRARPSFRRLHRTATASPAPSRRFPAPLWLLLLQPTITAAAPLRSRALPLPDDLVRVIGFMYFLYSERLPLGFCLSLFCSAK
ncbi:hypothetical protein DEO72_LG2g3317 [Vigna unguiculata]|uniref:Uncharacterized protein n=1 Tax=Vigna unguiculata TaxID=3917 RepID=A0A4D6L3E2_VIGUN|nr:hypothetical protein DEO72_LG2g3317 [Vigna unguiculata]